jgi:hypothetical protein
LSYTVDKSLELNEVNLPYPPRPPPPPRPPTRPPTGPPTTTATPTLSPSKDNLIVAARRVTVKLCYCARINAILEKGLFF